MDAQDIPSGKRRSPTLRTAFSRSRSNGSALQRREGSGTCPSTIITTSATGIPSTVRLKCFIMEGRRRVLGCLLFEGITRNLRCRDESIGRSDAQKSRTRHLVVVNSRYVVFDGVRCPTRPRGQPPGSWHHRYGCRPVLVETLVDTARFRGSSCKAVNRSRLRENGGAMRSWCPLRCDGNAHRQWRRFRAQRAHFLRSGQDSVREWGGGGDKGLIHKNIMISRICD